MFANSEDGYESSEYVILGVPFDKTSSFRAGASAAPRTIREASYCFEPYLFEYETTLDDLSINDIGDIADTGSTEEMREELESRIKNILSDSKFPIVIGGEHSLTPPVVSSVKETFGDIGVLVLDAHLDFRDEYEGMKMSHATTVRRVSDITGFDIDDIMVFGVRSISEKGMDSFKPPYRTSYEIREMDDSKKDLTDILKRFEDKEGIYLSIDLDVIDPAFAPGVGNPEPFGLFPKHIKDMISGLSDRLVGMDIVEVCPKYDRSERTSILAARLIYELLGSRS